MIRLDRLLSNRGYCSRRAVKSELGRVLVDGKHPKRVDDKVDPSTVTWDGEALDPERLVLLMNKPCGATCSHKEAGTLVYDLLPERYRDRDPALSTVGRLDKDTTGALLITDDGDLLHRLTSPKHKVAKVYEAWLSEPLSADDERTLTSGTLVLDEQPVRPAALERLDDQHVLLTLTEGRYHQVKRMFSAVGNEVLRLHRLTFAGLSADALAPGEWRELSAEELAKL